MISSLAPFGKFLRTSRFPFTRFLLFGPPAAKRRKKSATWPTSSRTGSASTPYRNRFLLLRCFERTSSKESSKGQAECGGTHPSQTPLRDSAASRARRRRRGQPRAGNAAQGDGLRRRGRRPARINSC